MTPGRFVIPTASVLGLCLTTACSTDPLVGEWDVTEATPRGQEAKTVPYSYDANGWTYIESFHMTVGRDLGGSFVSTYNRDPFHVYHHTWYVQAQDLGERHYDIQLANPAFPMSFSCTLGDTLLDCDDPHSSEYWENLKFQRTSP